MRERDLSVDHVTIFRWLKRCASEINKRMRSRRKNSQCFRSFHNAERTLEGIEALHMRTQVLALPRAAYVYDLETPAV